MTAIMGSLFDTRRYLTDFDSSRTGNILTDVLVIGSGVAGMRAAIEAAEYGLVTLVTKGEFDQSATCWAQGGIAAAIASEDSPELHLEDTMRVGCGLNRREAVELLVNDGPRRVEELINWGIALDRENGRLALGREGGHSVNRIIHARGDQTGRELVRTLKQRVRETEDIRVFEGCFFIDFMTLDGVCVGAVAFHEQHGHQLIWAKQTILASGGCGQLWRETTNPSVATGDGIAAAYRAQASLCNMEMVQFHPTTLYVAGASRALISEAVRGEGAHLVDRDGDRFMQDYDPVGELAPRDIVSRAIHSHLDATRSNCVYLDVRQIRGFRKRFPYIAQLCADFDIDVTRDLIPVRPTAHYMIGGVDVALDGSTSVEGLLCCGEAACSGVNGANRLASNSLLEGLVFGRLAGETAGRGAGDSGRPVSVRQIANKHPRSPRTELDIADIGNSLRSVMWHNVGIVRSGDRLGETRDILDFWGHYTLDKTLNEVAGWETQNKLTVSRLVVMSALERDESIGVHCRGDAPNEAASAPYEVRITRDPNGTKPVRSPVQIC
jgi:L-aspartate oxidase